MESFVKLNAVLNKIKNIFKCHMCSQIKNENSTVFYWDCDHFLCLDCIGVDKPCLICSAECGESRGGKPVRITENENILSIFRSLNLTSEEIGGGQRDEEKKKSPRRKLDKSVQLERKEKFKTPQRMVPKREPTSSGKRSAVGSSEGLVDSNKDDCTQKKEKKKLNVSKRNHKGETPLHLACRKGNLSLMQELIDAGANPNVQDNAGWTPLHDSIAFGRRDVIKFLLENGARVNTPGHENTTALHQAVTEGNADVARLLLRHGADKNARDIYGETPLCLARKFKLDHMEEVMVNTPVKFSASRVRSDDSIMEGEVILYACHLSDSEKAVFDEFVNEFKYRTVMSLSSENVASHIVVSESESPTVNWEIVQGVLMCCHVISVKWMKDSVASRAVQSMDKYRAVDDFYEGFTKSRRNRLEQLPGLFSGCHFYFGGSFDKYKTKHSTFPKSELRSLVERNGGVILSRNPDPESLALEKTIPYHAKVDSSVANTSYYIIYNEGAWDPAPKYNMSHMKTLPVEWLMESMRRFELVDPNADRSYMD